MSTGNLDSALDSPRGAVESMRSNRQHAAAPLFPRAAMYCRAALCTRRASAMHGAAARPGRACAEITASCSQ
jgi:hypothetical protein